MEIGNRQRYRVVNSLASKEHDPEERIYVEVKMLRRSPNSKATKIVRRGDVVHLVTGTAKGATVNCYESLDSTTPNGTIVDRDILTVHVPRPESDGRGRFR